jgi:hypothetical protein
MPLPNRTAVYLVAGLALLGALAPVIADMDFESVAGIAAGLAAISAVAYKWLDGWSKYERGEGQALLPGELADEFDETAAEPIPESAVAAARVSEEEARHGTTPQKAPPSART